MQRQLVEFALQRETRRRPRYLISQLKRLMQRLSHTSTSVSLQQAHRLFWLRVLPMLLHNLLFMSHRLRSGRWRLAMNCTTVELEIMRRWIRLPA